MKKADTRSFKIHDAEYRTTAGLEYSKAKIKEYDDIDLFSANGFRNAVERAKHSATIHIDIGSGSGWLLIKTAPHFKRVIGIEPSSAAVDVAAEITKGIPNIEYVNKDMVEGIKAIAPREPTFLTTGIVLSHIRDFHVKSLARALDSLPDGSILYFDEPYGTNVHQKMWYIRSKQWWANNLSAWELEFTGRPGNGYLNGIFGRKVGAGKRSNSYIMSGREKIAWHIEGMRSRAKRLARGAGRLAKKAIRK